VLKPEARARATSEHERAMLALDVKDHVKTRLSKHKYPRWVVFVDDLPKNDRGKVDRKSLREREARGENPKGD
jgi:acyl-coenzyme A synthetase/AMP-(fatty) acid ligase